MLSKMYHLIDSVHITRTVCLYIVSYPPTLYKERGHEKIAQK